MLHRYKLAEREREIKTKQKTTTTTKTNKKRLFVNPVSAVSVVGYAELTM